HIPGVGQQQFFIDVDQDDLLHQVLNRQIEGGGGAHQPGGAGNANFHFAASFFGCLCWAVLASPYRLTTQEVSSGAKRALTSTEAATWVVAVLTSASYWGSTAARAAGVATALPAAVARAAPA